MKRPCLWLAVASALSVNLVDAAAHAQTGGARMQLELLAMAKAPGMLPVAAPWVGNVAKGQTQAQTVELRGGRCYMFLAAGGYGFGDIDLHLFNVLTNKEVGSDTGGDAMPYVRFCPGWPAQYRIEVWGRNGAGEVALQTWASPLPPGPAPAEAGPAERVEDAFTAMLLERAALVAPGARRLGGLLRGAGNGDSKWDATFNLEAGRCYTLFGAGGPGIKHLNLYLWDPKDHRVAENRSDTHESYLQYCPMVHGPHHFQMKIGEGSGEIRTVLLVHPPQPGQATEKPDRPGATSGPDAIEVLLIEDARTAAVGLRRIGDFLRSSPDSGRPLWEHADRTDWTVALEAGTCYTFLTAGGPGIRRMQLQLWDPTGKRVAEHTAKRPVAAIGWCTQMPGPYHLQAHAEEGRGQYRAALFAK